MRRVWLPLCLAAALSAPASADDFARALQASSEGRHGEAAATFHSLARAGDGEAAYNLAVLFATGRGLPQNDAEALFWAWHAWLAGVHSGDLVTRLQARLPADHQATVARRLAAELEAAAQAGDGKAMLQLAAVLVEAAPQPDPVAAYGWQALAAALDVPGAAAARDAAFLALPKADRTAAQDKALRRFRDWCAKRDAAALPPPCQVQ